MLGGFLEDFLFLFARKPWRSRDPLKLISEKKRVFRKRPYHACAQRGLHAYAAGAFRERTPTHSGAWSRGQRRLLARERLDRIRDPCCCHPAATGRLHYLCFVRSGSKDTTNIAEFRTPGTRCVAIPNETFTTLEYSRELRQQFARVLVKTNCS